MASTFIQDFLGNLKLQVARYNSGHPQQQIETAYSKIFYTAHYGGRLVRVVWVDDSTFRIETMLAGEQKQIDVWKLTGDRSHIRTTSSQRDLDAAAAAVAFIELLVAV